MNAQPKKDKTSFALSPASRQLLRELAQQHGVSMSAVLELVIRERARLMGVLPPLETHPLRRAADR